ncbi:stemmadenine O-acetyltransferase-like [Solanum dulcamara]|uniref:stemmadenine O-acetyltransferase-like n=1 Tax=Solanum dulcamara TaxID=45834 RepID=UPI0024866863|nr:stemmadenine O-acetyltransferase-like [Solanum dulcamara]
MVMISTNTSVEVVSRETIKPLCPTPNHLRNYILSSIDQNSPPIYIPVLLFYLNSAANIINTHQKLIMLRKSLAECLSEYYPLAGTFRDDYSVVECNDEGAEFIEARVNFDISQIIGTSNVKLLNQLLPFESTGNWGKFKEKTDEREVLVAAQANLFRCGGLALGVCISHKIADGTSVVAFLNSWASKSLNNYHGDHAKIVPPPIFDSAKNFPPREMPRYSHDTGITNKTIVTKRFIFDSSSILALRNKASNAISTDEYVKFPTRVQAVSSLIWSRVLALYRSKPKYTKICVAVHAVNIRPRMEQPVPNHFFGNYWTVAIASAVVKTEQNVGDITLLVEKMNKSIRNINADYVKNMNVVALVSDSPKVHRFLKTRHSHDNNFKESEQLRSRLNDNSVETTVKDFMKGDLEVCNFTSWCRFPVYEVDFGWGKPEWICSPIRSFKNLVILMGTKHGNGIEASINLLEEDMPLFENDPEILSFANYCP